MSSIQIETGSEGPTHDPYAWEEITVCRPNGTEVTIHYGLDNWVRVDEGEKLRPEWDDAKLQQDLDSIDRVFETHAGCTPAVAHKAYQRVQYMCKKCGVSDLDEVGGMPGETMNVCRQCGNVVSVDFNLSAII